MVESTVTTPKLVPAPERILTLVVARTVLPGAQPLDIVAVRLGVAVAVGVFVGTVAVAVTVADGEVVCDGVEVIDGVAVTDGVNVLDGVVVTVRVGEGVLVAIGVRVGVAVPIADTQFDATQPSPSAVETGMNAYPSETTA